MTGAQGNGENGGAAGIQAVVAAVCADFGNRADALLEIFHRIQDRLGYVPGEGLDPIAKALNLSRAEVHGVFTFYHDFRDAPAGRHVIKLCRAEACQAVGADALAAAAEAQVGPLAVPPAPTARSLWKPFTALETVPWGQQR